MIQYLRHSEIDFIKWDNCIDNAINGLPYAFAWYLDIVAEGQWNALIIDDYAAVFPIPFKNRIVYKQIYQPFFTQQLGLFYTDVKYALMVAACISTIPSAFKKINLQLNTANSIGDDGNIPKFKVTHHISLNVKYETILAGYNSNTKRNLKKADAAGLKLVDLNDVSELISFRRKYLVAELNGVQTDKDLYRLQKLLEKALLLGKGIVKGVVDANNNLSSIIFLLQSNGYLIYLSAVSSDEGKKIGAMNYLIDGVLKQFCMSNIIFDFEGSMIAGLAQYYKGFGGVEVKFPVLQK